MTQTSAMLSCHVLSVLPDGVPDLEPGTYGLKSRINQLSHYLHWKMI